MDDRSDDELDRLVDVLLSPDGYALLRAGDEPVAAAVAALGSLAEEPTDDVAELHLARLLGGATVAGSAQVVDLTARRRRMAVSSAAGLVLAATLLCGVGTAAASDALPGDALYGLKTARERVELALAPDGDGKAAVHLRNARARLDEAAALLRRGAVNRGVTTIARADAALAAAEAAGSDELDRLADAEVARRVDVLGALLDGGLPDQAADAARDALQRALARERDDAAAPGRGADGRGNAPDAGDPSTGSGGGSGERPGNRPSTPPSAAPSDPPRSGARPSGPPAGSGRPDGTPGHRPTTRPANPSQGRSAQPPGVVPGR